MDWFIWRLLVSEHLNVTMRELADDWSLADVATAHELLDVLEG